MKNYQDIQIAVIGGSGLYGLDGFTVIDEVYPETPWGTPSDVITIVQTPTAPFTKVAFLARHGRGHFLNPTEIPVRANIAALKSLGVKVILSFSAVGSLREEIRPLDFVLPNQLIDRTKGIRHSSFFENGLVAHCSFGDPFDSEIADVLFSCHDADLGPSSIHKGKTVICMEGPAFSTRAESNMYRAWGGDIINMSMLPEAKLAREAEICYQPVCMVTDYDAWKMNEEAVTVEHVLSNLNLNSQSAKRLLLEALPLIGNALAKEELKCISTMRNSMKFACITSKEKRNPMQVAKLEYLLPGYF